MKTAGLAIATLVVSACLVSAAGAQVPDNIELGLNGGGVFPKDLTSTNGAVTVTATKSVAVFGTIQYHFNRMHSVEMNLGHTSNSQIFAIPPDSFRVKEDVFELSGAYVFNPFAMKKLNPFLLAGAGALRFSPGNAYIDGQQAQLGTSRETALAFVYGGGADYHLWRAFSLRLQYRGFLYKEPSFTTQRFFTGTRGHMAEPSAGITVRF